MTENKEHPNRPQVRAENPSGACGNVDHMTVDELKARAVGDTFDGTCPACGMFHLTKADIAQIDSEKISETQEYADMKKAAEEA